MRVSSLIAALIVCIACGSPEVQPPPSLPAGADLHTPPEPLPAGEPGDVIWADPMTPAPDGVSAWNVLYHSTDLEGRPIAVSGWIAIPDGTDPVPVIGWGHGTTGLGDECAPTRRGGQRPHNFGPLLEQGWAVAFTDYQGLGTPDLHHYLVGRSEASSLIDAVRAAGAFDQRVGDEVGFMGFSQGGHAALFAGALAGDLAPEFDVVGTVAIAPVVDVSGWLLEDPPGQRHFLAMIAVAYADAMGLDPGSALSDDLWDRYDQISEGCLMDATIAVSGVPEVFRDGLPPEVLEFAESNDPGRFTQSAPVLLVTGSGDPLLTPEVADDFAVRFCETGSSLDRIVLDVDGHLAVAGAGMEAAVDWFADRLGGLEMASSCR